MYPVLFKFGVIEVHAYGFFVALAFLFGTLVSLHYAKKEGIRSETILDLVIYVIIAAIVGSRLFYVIGQWDQFKDAPLEMFMVQKGGLVFLGGFLLAFLTVIGYAKIKGIPLLKFFDVLAPGTALGYSIARIGCFLNGCCFGLPTKSGWGVVFPFGSLAYSYFPGEHLHPTQLYSLALMLIVFFVLVRMYRSKKFDGQIACWWFILYAVYRFLVEFLRFSPIHWLGLTPSQWLVLPLFIFGLWGLNHYNKQPGA